MCLSSCIFIGYRDQSHVCFRVGEAFVVWMSLSIFGLQRYTMLATSIHSMLCSLHLKPITSREKHVLNSFEKVNKKKLSNPSNETE